MTSPTEPVANSGPGRGAIVGVIVGGIAVIAVIVAVSTMGGSDNSTVNADNTGLGDDAGNTGGGEGGEDSGDSSDTTQDTTSNSSTPTNSADAVGASTSDLARATVQLVQLDDRGQLACFTGSGSIVEASGIILTNAHVVWNDPECPYQLLGVAVTTATDRPPELMYLGEVAAFDEFLDLAVVRISSDIDSGELPDLNLPFVALGNSSTVDLGDELRILGFPGIGGDTITFTEGVVSGFVAERGVDATRAWIKTDATIAGGNSGGMAVNDAGELVGVPTTAGAGDEASTTDCRIVEDTNSDGFIDDQDSCIPIGGFINGLRPINLAADLLAEASTGAVVGPVGPAPVDEIDFDPEQVLVRNWGFSPGVTDDDQPTEVVDWMPSGPPRICVFWEYEGLADGLSYDALWRIDGELDPEGSFLGDLWAGGSQGEWWVCVTNDGGLADGVYEFEFAVEGETIGTDALYIGGSRGRASINVNNQAGHVICFVQIAPTLAGFWGPDELGPTDVIDAGSSRVFEVISGRYDVRLADCDGNPLEELIALDIVGDEAINYTG